MAGPFDKLTVTVSKNAFNGPGADIRRLTNPHLTDKIAPHGSHI